MLCRRSLLRCHILLPSQANGCGSIVGFESRAETKMEALSSHPSFNTFLDHNFNIKFRNIDACMHACLYNFEDGCTCLPSTQYAHGRRRVAEKTRRTVRYYANTTSTQQHTPTSTKMLLARFEIIESGGGEDFFESLLRSHQSAPFWLLLFKSENQDVKWR